MCRTIWRAKKQAPIPTNIVTPRTPLPDPKCLKSKTFSAPLLLLHRPPIPVSPSIGRRSIAAPIRCQNWRPTKGERPSRDHPWQQDRHRYRARVRRLVLTKKKPSRFFGTPLPPYLVGRQIDTLLLTSSSICNSVRPAVFDAFSSKIL